MLPLQSVFLVDRHNPGEYEGHRPLRLIYTSDFKLQSRIELVHLRAYNFFCLFSKPAGLMQNRTYV